MMSSRFISRVFRFFNSKLIYADNIIVEKLLKIILLLSGVVYRRQRKSKGNNITVLVENFDSTIKMEVDISRSMGSAIYWTGFHEFREFIFLHRFLKPEMIFVDIGANQGEYSLFAAKRLTQGRVLAFEPLPSILKVLKKNIELNQFKVIEVFELGLSDKEEMLKIHEIEDEHEGLATFYPGERKGLAEFEVQLKTLDDVVEKSNCPRVDFIKLDIEGGELKALKGSRKTIGKFKPLVMVEINNDTYQAAGYSSTDIVEFFSALNYHPFMFMKRGIIKRCSILPKFGNLIFKPE